MNRERLRRIRNYQSQDAYPALVLRPLCILVMLVVADWRWLTPNRLTTLANLCKAAAVVLLVPAWVVWLGLAPWPATVAAVVLLQLGALFDHLDGTMARYRGSFTSLGSLYDKSSDMVTWSAIALAVGWRAYVATGAASMIVLAAASAAALSVCGYAKWVLAAETHTLRWCEATVDPGVVARQAAPPASSVPPERAAGDWLRWFARRVGRFATFEEMDLFLWVGVGVLLDRLTWLCWLLFVTQCGNMLAMLFVRHRQAHAIDLALRPHRPRPVDASVDAPGAPPTAAAAPTVDGEVRTTA